LFIVNFLITYPLIIYPANIIVEHYIYEGVERTPKRKWLKNTNRAILVLFTMFMGLYFEETIDRLTSVVGSLFLTPIAFILPATFHLRLVAEDIKQYILDLSIIIIGVVLMLVVTTYTLVNWNIELVV
jgi:solute carrier family 36 (proton-coupled amino acid transporter)